MLPGRNYTSVEVAKRLSQVSPAPIFGLLDAALGHGSCRSSLINFERIGTKAGELVLDILRGTPTPNNIPRVSGRASCTDVRLAAAEALELEREGSPQRKHCHKQKLTIWDFKYYIIGGLALLPGPVTPDRRTAVTEASEGCGRGIAAAKNRRTGSILPTSPSTYWASRTTDGYFLRLNPAVERILVIPRRTHGPAVLRFHPP